MTGAFRGISPASALSASVFFCAQLDDCALCLCDFLSACWRRATGFSMILDPGPAVTAQTCLERRGGGSYHEATKAQSQKHYCLGSSHGCGLSWSLKGS